MIGQRVGRYRVLERIGKGGMGEVYLAEDTSLGRRVALKFRSEDLQQDDIAHKRFIREAKAAASLDHPFICNVHEVDQTDSKQDFIVMEFVPGKSLSKLLAKGPLPLLDSLKVMIEVSEALQVAHNEGIVHRDLKPSNIMITTDGHSKVMDFGLAKRTEQSDDPEITSVLTEEGKVLGTPAYMSPEQLQGQDFDTRADIFSLGVLSIQLLTGVHPFHKPSTAATVSAILHDPPRGLNSTSLPEELRQILRRMLEKTPRKRYADCGELIADLQEAISVLSYPTTPIYPFQKRWWRANWRKVILVAGAAALIFGGIFHKSIIDYFQLAPLPGNLTVAVLPFSVLAEDASVEACAAGINENLARTLAGLSQRHPFNVMPSDLVRSRKVLTPSQIGGLGANVALLGTFRANPQLATIELALVAGNSNRRLRRASISGPYEDSAALQTKLVDKAVEMLGSTVAASDRQIAYDVEGFRNPLAYHFYLRGLGCLIQKDEELDSAIENFQNALQHEGRSATARASLGISLLEKSRFQENPILADRALAHCLQARDSDEDCYEAHMCLGEALLDRDQVADALTSFQSAYRLDQTSDRILDRLELVYVRLGKTDGIEDLYRDAIRRKPEFWWHYNRLGVLYYKSQRYDEAIAYLKRVVELAPQYQRTFSNLGSCYAKLFCWEQALPMFEMAREIGDQPDVVGTNIATAHYFSGRFSDALAEARGAIIHLRESEPTHGDHKNYGNLADIHAWSVGGVSRNADHCYQQAAKLAEEDLKLYPGHPETLSYLAYYYAMISEPVKALEKLDQALQPGKDDTETLYMAALTHRVLGNQEASIEYLERYFESGGSSKRPDQDPAFDEIRGLPEYQRMVAQFPDPSGCPEQEPEPLVIADRRNIH